MSDELRITFDDLSSADLPRGAVLEAGPGGGIGGEPISRVLTVGNQGGIRASGVAARPHYIALYSRLDHADWPDRIDRRSGVLTYHGDNLRPERGPLEMKGNQALHSVFRRGLDSEKDRLLSPPLFVFTRVEGPGIPSRSVRFEGVAVPGAVTAPEEDWFVAKWFRGSQGRFENYVLLATILDVPVVSRNWLDELDGGQTDGPGCPAVYRQWIETGQPRSISDGG